MTYQLCNLHGVLDSIVLIEDNKRTSIPLNPDNTDYQEYLKYIAQGGTVLPAEDNS